MHGRRLGDRRTDPEQVSAILRPIAAGPPVSRRFTAELVEQVD